MHKGDRDNDIKMHKGDRVRIKGGSFTDHLFGTFIRYCGSQKVCVKLDDDMKAQRTLNRASIRPVNLRDEQLHGHWRVRGLPFPSAKTTSTANNDSNGDDLDDLLEELSAMKLSIGKMLESVNKIEDRIKACK
jgi:hypothetical protein